MNVSIKFATTLVLTTGALIAAISTAQAGEGGAAGSVSVLMDESKVTNLSAAAAVGKNSAAAATLTTSGNTSGSTSASAHGSAGPIDLKVGSKLVSDYSSNPPYGAIGTHTQDITYTNVGENPNTIGTAQANTLTGKTTIDAKTGTVIIPNVSQPSGSGNSGAGE